MIEIKGKYNTAYCYTDLLEASAEAQIRAVCDREEFSSCKIRIMPDVHAGKGCTIGTAMTVTDKVVPGMVGVDIGCGMESVRIAERDIDFDCLDTLIRRSIPCGREIRDEAHPLASECELEALRCKNKVNLIRGEQSIGTLGGGNHFIEVDRDSDGNLWLVVHSGSRHIGTEVANYYQDEAYRALCGNSKAQIMNTIIRLREEGRFTEIQTEVERLKAIKKHTLDIPSDLTYVEGTLFDDYIHDMKLVQRYAALNRLAITEVILSGMGLTEEERFTTVHNYIDTEEMILRKGAVSAKKGEKLLIPMNMRDGSLICIGKGNEDWNCSAPHGAGRLMSRNAAFSSLSLEEYKTEMEGIYTTCVSTETLDESPMAYKPMASVLAHLSSTADVIDQIRPVYNFKASE